MNQVDGSCSQLHFSKGWGKGLQVLGQFELHKEFLSTNKILCMCWFNKYINEMNGNKESYVSKTWKTKFTSRSVNDLLLWKYPNVFDCVIRLMVLPWSCSHSLTYRSDGEGGSERQTCAVDVGTDGKRCLQGNWRNGVNLTFLCFPFFKMYFCETTKYIKLSF